MHQVNITIDVERLKNQPLLPEILVILKVIRPEWQIERLQAKVFTGGISNHLYGYYVADRFHEDVVLFRIDGEDKDLMLDTERDRENMQFLHEAGCGPPVYALFNNGMVYGYIQGETIDHVIVRDELVRKLIAREMCRLHAVKPDIESSKRDSWKKLSFRLLDLTPDGFPGDPEKNKRYKELIKSKDRLREELEQLWCHLEALDSPIVFCHNDLLLGNIIYNKEKGTVNFIDFEFAMYNYEHYEVASHFCEYIGTEEIDLKRYPDKSYQIDWIRYYLQCKAELNGGSADDVTERDIEDFYVKTNKFALVSHFACGTWGLVQAKVSKLDYDFLGYENEMPHNLDIFIDAEKLKENPTSYPEVFRVLEIIRPNWQKENIRVKNFTSGFSNALFGYYEEGKFSEDVVMFRIHNETTKNFTDRKQEGETMQKLNSVGFGVPVFAVFNNGLVHGYIHGETLQHSDMKDVHIRKLISKEICRLHAAVSVKDFSDRSQWKKFVLNLRDMIPDGFPDDPKKDDRFKESIPSKTIISQELDELWQHLDSLQSPVVFCHNDLSHLNIIYNRDKGSVHFIDYEYAMFNCEHYEIGHHFCFMAGLGTEGIDLTNFPDRGYQLGWVRDYLECKAEFDGGRSVTGVTDNEIGNCCIKANQFALENMLTLAIGGLVQARFSNGSFDFIKFSKGMFDAYFSKKKEFMSSTASKCAT